MKKAIRTLDKLFSIFSAPHPFTSAIIVAGGSGVRMGGSVTKQHMLLRGIPVVVHTLLNFENSQDIDEIILVSKREEIPLYQEYIKKYSLRKIKRITAGGSTRTESVLNGFRAISDKSRFVAIHDGVRCLITPKNISDVLGAAYHSGAACAVRICTDTVKSLNTTGQIVSTIDRDFCRLATTPQVFKTELYQAAVYTAKKDGFSATDDSALVERLGFFVTPVDCGNENIKITTPTDLLLAESILHARSVEERKESI